jgi:hypothetical protein
MHIDVEYLSVAVLQYLGLGVKIGVSAAAGGHSCVGVAIVIRTR